MPVAVRHTPFITLQEPPPADTKLRIPQARVLAALVPDPNADPMDWPMLNRALLGVRAGYTAISGTVTRALKGIYPGSSSGDPHPGLLDRKLIEEVVLDVDGVKEVNYRATAAGVAAYRTHIATVGGLPKVKDRAICTNDRYAKKEST